MDDKLKVFWNLDVLVKMCRSKSDGPSLRIEEEEIVEKIEACNLEIEEIKSQSDEDSYDTSAEMADRNIEIITKKQLQTLKNTLKEKNKELNTLKEEEQNLYSNNSLLRENKLSQERMLLQALSKLSGREKMIIYDRYFNDKTQMEIASELGISQAQISRIEKNAINNIKKLIK